MNKAAILVVLCIAVATAVSVREAQNEFVKFQRTYNKVYSSSEFATRFAIFRANMLKAAEHQKLNPQATFGVTKFMDLSHDEFAKFYLNKNIQKYINGRAEEKTDFSEVYTSASAPEGPNAKNWDWFTQGVCTQVYNQGQCGSCWAFSATETIESYFKIAGNTLTQLSMEQIVDCDTTDEGCNGGFPTNAYQYVESAGGIENYNDYPYTAEGGESGTCNFNAADVVATVKSYSAVNGETGLYKQASTAGPVSVCVAADTWQTYTGGVITTCDTQVDHCVQLTGYANYGTSNAYWIVRNSWGADWGEAGFIWVAIGQDLCEIGDYASIVVAGKAGTSSSSTTASSSGKTTGSSTTGSSTTTGTTGSTTTGTTGTASSTSGTTGSSTTGTTGTSGQF